MSTAADLNHRVARSRATISVFNQMGLVAYGREVAWEKEWNGWEIALSSISGEPLPDPRRWLDVMAHWKITRPRLEAAVTSAGTDAESFTALAERARAAVLSYEDSKGYHDETVREFRHYPRALGDSAETATQVATVVRGIFFATAAGVAAAVAAR